MAWRDTVTIGEDNVVQLRGVYDVVSRQYLNEEGGITGTVFDEDGTLVVPSFSFTYVDGSNGDYTGVVPASAPFQNGSEYTVVVSGTVGNDVVVNRRFNVLAQYNNAT